MSFTRPAFGARILSISGGDNLDIYGRIKINFTFSLSTKDRPNNYFILSDEHLTVLVHFSCDAYLMVLFFWFLLDLHIINHNGYFFSTDSAYQFLDTKITAVDVAVAVAVA